MRGGTREKSALKSITNVASPRGFIYESLRSFLMFKSFTFAAFNKLFMRQGAFEGRGAKVKYLTAMVALTTIGGAAAVQLQALRNGEDPEDMGSDPESMGKILG